jgi:predicted ATPase
MPCPKGCHSDRWWAERLGDDRWPLVLDNLEQVLEVAGDLEELLARCGGVTVLATSRTVLGLRAEQEYPVLPLLLPADPATMTVAQLAASPAVALFVRGMRSGRGCWPGAAEDLRRRVGLRAWPSHRRAEAALVDQIRRALGADRFDRAFAAGAPAEPAGGGGRRPEPAWRRHLGILSGGRGRLAAHKPPDH